MFGILGPANTATVEIDGIKQEYNVANALVYVNGVQVGYIEDGKIMIEEADFNRDFNIAGTMSICSYWDPNEAFNISNTNIRSDAFSGHAYLEYTPINGSTDTYGTHPDYEKYSTPEGMYKNFEPDRNLMNSEHTAKYTKKLLKIKRLKCLKQFIALKIILGRN